MTKHELHEVRRLHEQICELENYLQFLRRRLHDVTPKLDGMPRAAPLESKIERITATIIDGERELESCRLQLQMKTATLTQFISRHVDKPPIRELLLLRYVDCLSFRDICRRLQISERTMFRLHREGISKLAVAWQ